MNPVIKGFKIYDAMPSNETLIKKHSINSEKIVKLNGNENPFGPVPEVIDNLINIPINTYPDPELIRSRESLSEYTGLSIDNIVASSGSDELIDLFFRIFVTPGDEVLDFTPTFGMYAVRAGLAGAKIVPVSRNIDFELDYESIKQNAQIEGIWISKEFNNLKNQIINKSHLIDYIEADDFKLLSNTEHSQGIIAEVNTNINHITNFKKK